MSRRFGRNQRRRAREQFAALEYEHGLLLTKSSMQDGSLQKAASRVRELEVQLEMARRYLGENSPAFPPNRHDPGYKPYRDEPFYIPGRAGPSEAVAMQVVRRDSEDMRDQVHFLLYAGPECWGYAITRHALAEAPREVIARHIITVMVDMMLDKMNTGGRR